jgi:hypothetical protein
VRSLLAGTESLSEQQRLHSSGQECLFVLICLYVLTYVLTTETLPGSRLVHACCQLHVLWHLKDCTTLPDAPAVFCTSKLSLQSS